MTIVPVEVRQKFRWFKEDSFALLNNLKFMKLSAEERGVFFSLRLAAWTSGTVPTAPEDLHVLTRLELDVLERVVPKLLAADLFATAHDGASLYLPAFEEAMEKNWQNLLAQQEGGRRGGQSRKRRVRRDRRRPESDPIDRMGTGGHYGRGFDEEEAPGHSAIEEDEDIIAITG